MPLWPPAFAFPVTLLAAVALVLAYDALSASLAARNPAFPYRTLWPVQLALYVFIGFCATFTLFDPRHVAAVGAITGFVEATAGWAITWRIGPGRVAAATRPRIALAILAMTAFGFGLALAGAWIFVQVAAALARSAH